MSQQKSNRQIIVDSTDLANNSNEKVPEKKSKEEKEPVYFNRV